METSKEHEPLLLKLTWIEAKTRDGKQLSGGPMYAVNGRYVYRRRPTPSNNYSYCRVLVSKVYLLTYWYEIQESWWEQVNYHGIPVPRELSR
jgi:hypothetical protein